jgi:hypothetical protein
MSGSAVSGAIISFRRREEGQQKTGYLQKEPVDNWERGRAMNKYEEQASLQRQTTLRSSMSVWTACLALVVVALLIIGFKESAPPDYFYKGAIAVAVLMLLLRQVARRLKTNGPRAARPDPKSTLKLS